ncbi:MAG: cadherin-like domain-containing protein [Planctomycetaceae bacterium]|nr:cadherin-like domain-containing protein [Planctomycetaceae bacterium]
MLSVSGDLQSVVFSDVSSAVYAADSSSPPMLSGIEGDVLEYTENSAPIQITSTLIVEDADDTTLMGASVSISGNYIAGEDWLRFTDTDTVIGTFDLVTGSLFLSGAATLADYQSALREVRYENTSDGPSTALRTMSFVGTDGLAPSNLVSRQLSIIPADDAPIAQDDATTTERNVPKNIDVLANDLNPDGQALLITIVSASNGVASVNDNGTFDDLTDDTVDFTPSPDFLGTADFVYRINDGNLESEASVAIEVVVEPAVLPTLSLPRFVCGPGQSIRLSGNQGLPLVLENGDGVTSISMAIVYDSELLSITDVVLGPDAPEGSMVTANLETSGQVVLAFYSLDPLPDGPLELVLLESNVPISADYGAAHLLDIVGVEVNAGAMPATAVDGGHLVAYMGDMNRNQRYDPEDARLIARVGMGLDADFEAYPGIDPVLIGDVTGDGTLSPLDCSHIMQAAVGLGSEFLPDIVASVSTYNPINTAIARNNPPTVTSNRIVSLNDDSAGEPNGLESDEYVLPVTLETHDVVFPVIQSQTSAAAATITFEEPIQNPGSVLSQYCRNDEHNLGVKFIGPYRIMEPDVIPPSGTHALTNYSVGTEFPPPHGIEVSFTTGQEYVSVRAARMDIYPGDLEDSLLAYMWAYSSDTPGDMADVVDVDIALLGDDSTFTEYAELSVSSPTSEIRSVSINYKYTDAAMSFPSDAWELIDNLSFSTPGPPDERNGRPIANEQSVFTDKGMPVGIQLSGDDGDPGVVQELTCSIDTPPVHGDLTEFDSSVGTLVYTPRPDYSGTDVFTFTVTDHIGGGVQGLTSTPATVAIVVLPGEDPDAPVSHNVIAESGVVMLSQPDATSWQTVHLQHTFTHPIVIAGPLTANGSDPAAVRIRNVKSNSFQVQVDEWDYLDGAHVLESLSYLVVEEGVHPLSDDAQFVAGYASSNQDWTTITFPSTFEEQPVVLSQVQTRSGSSAVVTRHRSATATGFQVRLQEEEGSDGTHATETVGYLAITPGTGHLNGIDYDAVLTSDEFTDAWQEVGVTDPAIFLAGIQSYNGGDPVGMRYRHSASTGVSVKLEEEKSADDEVGHTTEKVGYLALSTSGFLRADHKEFYEQLALRWAPIHYQLTEDLETRQDFLTSVDFDGNWDISDNTTNLAKLHPATQDWVHTADACAYYSVTESATHWYIVYGFYHPIDWQSPDGHDHDFQTMLAVVRKPDATETGVDEEISPYGELQGIVTQTGSEFLANVTSDSSVKMRAPDLSPSGKYDGATLTFETFAEDGLLHPQTMQQPQSHDLSIFSPAVIDEPSQYFVVYHPSLTESEEPAGPDDHTGVSYKLVDIFEASGLWGHRFDPNVFAEEWGLLGEAAVPWKANDPTDELPPGVPATDPATLAAYAYTGDHFVQTYWTNRYVSADPYESDDSIPQAREIGIKGVPQTHTIHYAGDVDWATFVLTETSNVVIKTSGDMGDTKLSLYGQEETLIEQDDDDGPGRFSVINRQKDTALPPGTYYVRIVEDPDAGHDVIFSYTLSVSAQPSDIVNTSPQGVIGETGKVTITQANSSSWKTITLQHTFKDPVVIAGPLSFNGSDPATIRIRNVKSNSFQVQVDEWDYLDGSHTEETFSYFVMESGVYVLGNGVQLIAGQVDTNQNWSTLYFPSKFDDQPVVLSQVQTANGSSAVVTRHRASSGSGFEVRLQEEESNDGTHSVETVGYLAMTQSGGSLSGIDYEAFVISDVFTDAWQKLGSHNSSVLVAGVQSNYGTDPIGMRFRSSLFTGTEVRLEEETSKDSETGHVTEQIAYVTFSSPGLLWANGQEFREQLAYRWAPIHFQNTGWTGHQPLRNAAGAIQFGPESPIRELIVALDFDKNWTTNDLGTNGSDKGDSRTTAKLTQYPLDAYVYYSVSETKTHWFLLYAFYHPIDHQNYVGFGGHWHDFEGVMFVVRKDPNDTYGILEGCITQYHGEFLPYTPPDSALNKSDGVLSSLLFPRNSDGEGDGEYHPMTHQQKIGHGVKAWPYNLGYPNAYSWSVGVDHFGQIDENPERPFGVFDDGGIVYYPSLSKAEEPADFNDRCVYYKLVDILEPNGLWDHRYDPETFPTGWGQLRRYIPLFGSDDYLVLSDGANPPWRMNAQALAGLDPALFASDVFATPKYLNSGYRQNPYTTFLDDNAAIAYVDLSPRSFTPPRVRGDAEFQGHGPRVEVLAQLRIGPSGNLETRVYMEALEWNEPNNAQPGPRGDYTAARGWSAWKTAYTPPTGKKVARILGPTQSSLTYIDTSTEIDYIPRGSGSLVQRFEVVGDSDGNDAGVATCVKAYFNRVAVELVDQGDSSSDTSDGTTTIYLNEHTFVPPHTTGDRDFHGNGPKIALDAKLRIGDHGVLQTSVYMRAIEDNSDTVKTTAEGWSPWKTVYVPPPGKVVKRIISATQLPTFYEVDYDHVRSFRLLDDKGLVAAFEYVGDTDGPEAGDRTQVTAFFNPVQVELADASQGELVVVNPPEQFSRPLHIRGDREFGGNGPRVDVTAALIGSQEAIYSILKLKSQHC